MVRAVLFRCRLAVQTALTFSLGLLALPSEGWAQTDQPVVAFGGKHGVALRTNGDVVTWGDNVYCTLGRRTGNSSATPGLVLRNIKEIAVAGAHNLALASDGKVYAWGSDAAALGTADGNDRCEGPVAVSSLEGKEIVHIATGLMFSLAVTSDGDLLCTGDNDMGQCPPVKGTSNSFVPMTNPELSKNVAAVSAGAFHALVLTKDGKLYAFGRGRDGQLGNGRTANGFGLVPDLTDVASFGAGTWHSVAVGKDGTVWTWGSNGKSQLCDGTTTNRVVPTKVETLPAGVNITQVKTSGWSTLFRASDGRLFGCGDNQFGPLGSDNPALVPTPVLIASGTHAAGLAVNPMASAYSTDGCAVRMGGTNESSLVSTTDIRSAVPFAVRTGLSLCGPRSVAPVATVVNPAPSGGASGCWTPKAEEDASTNPKFAPLRQAMLSAEDLLKKNAAYLAAPAPVRFRTSLSAGPFDESGARMHIKAVPERKADGTRLWTAECGVIPQIDRIGGAIGQISIFFNHGAGGTLISPVGNAPKRTGTVAGFPEYDNWVLITRDGRLPWIPVTLAEKLDAEGKRRREALESWQKSRANMKPQDPAALQKTYQMLKTSDPAGAERFLASMKEQNDEIERQLREVYPMTTAALEKQVSDYEKYRASFSASELAAPAVLGDTGGDAKRKLDAEIARLQALTPDEQRQIDDLTRDARALERQAQAETANRNQGAAAKFRAEANALGLQARLVRQRHTEQAAPLMNDATAQYTLTNLRPGSIDQAISVKPDPAFPDPRQPGRVQMILVLFSSDPDPRQTARRAWQQQTKDTFHFAALAALVK